jgi:RNAse (barnase) inhibitor barstar
MKTYIEKDKKEDYYVAEFNTSELKSEKQFIDKFWESFNIPNEKIYNLNALNDCMTDLFWIEPKSFKIIIKNYYNYIQKGYNLDFVLENLNHYKKYWNNIGYKFIIDLE